MRLPTLLLALAIAATTHAQHAYYQIRIADLEFTEGELPGPVDASTHRNWDRMPHMPPRAVLDLPQAEVFISGPDQSRFTREGVRNHQLNIKAPANQPLTGTLIVPKPDYSEMVVTKFTINPDDTPANVDNAEIAFLNAKRDYYQGLQDRRIPGSAWFRYQANQTRAALGEGPRENERWQGREFDDAFAMFTGGRAVSENLQLNRMLPNVAAGTRTVDLDTIEGITIAEYDWEDLIAGAKPTLDPLATAIPFDQHAVFFPSFAEFMRILDELDKGDLPLFELSTPRPENARTLERYERQLALPRGALARLLGPSFVRSVALTGSDPYFPSGTDVAICFEPVNAEMLHEVLLAQIAASARAVANAEPVEGEIEGVAYQGYRSPTRTICSYAAVFGDTVVVTNSTGQLARLARTHAGKIDALASLEEYHFFRDRYSIDPSADAAHESAFLMLTDATIRRWAGPRWRIATARRMLATSLLADATARTIESPDGVVFVPGSEQIELATIKRTPVGLHSSRFGSLEFQTPIGELAIDKVTEAERDAYTRWRDGYQRNWRWAFDPVGVRFTVTDDRLATDLSVMPLIVGTRYESWIGISEGAQIGRADPHNTLAHFVTSINTDSPLMQNYSALAGGMLNLQFNPLDWIGQSLSIYADPDPFWAELANAEPGEEEDVMLAADLAIPVAVHVEVKSVVKLTAFLAAARGFIEQTAPDMTAWVPQRHNGQAYVRVGLTESAKTGQEFDDLAIFYAAMPKALIISPHEGVLQRAIEREQARRAGADDHGAVAEPTPWLGENIAMNVSKDGWRTMVQLFSDQFERRMQLRSWDNIPILNEWRMRAPGTDPTAFHLAQFRIELEDPAGGTYVWNERFRTMESSVYGHPGEPRKGPALADRMRSIGSGKLGLTFELDGLRARTELERVGDN